MNSGFCTASTKIKTFFFFLQTLHHKEKHNYLLNFSKSKIMIYSNTSILRQEPQPFNQNREKKN